MNNQLQKLIQLMFEINDDTYDHKLGMGLEDLMPDSPDGIDEETEPEAFSKRFLGRGKKF